MSEKMRDYWTIWKEFVLQGSMQDDVLPPALVQSWRRCAALGLDPYGPLPYSRRQEAKAASFRNLATNVVAATSSYEENLSLVVRPTLEDVYQFAEGSECVVVFADAQARIVDIVGPNALMQELEHLGVALSTSWSEEQSGANALALALHESFPIQLDGAMHYCVVLHPLYTSAAPVHDMLGQAVGVLAVIGRHEQCHPHTLGMVTAAAQAISNQLQMQVWLSNANDLLAELKTILQTLSEGILLLRHDGVISQMNAPAGTMLGLSPTKVTGRRLREVLALPKELVQALEARQLLSYEELVFETPHGHVTFLCTLKPIRSYQLETGLEDIVGSAGLPIAESSTADGFVLILRTIERVQRLVHRMTGTHARLTFANVIGESTSLKDALRLAQMAAQSSSTVLLHGETGTGKEIFAQSIHTSSSRAHGPFIAVNCAAIPRELISTELFGYEGGAFTGADRQGRPGKFEQAHGGTLFLDEIGDMPRDLQTSLLRAIETRTIVRVGGQRVIPADVRIIAATHKDLREEARLGNFRSDLFYRLNVLTIEIPPLRERIADLPILVRHFLQRQSTLLGRNFTITQEALTALSSYGWPGNIRELENMLDRVTYLTPKPTITVADLPLEIPRLHDSGNTSSTDTPNKPHLLPTSTPASQVLREQSTNAEVQAILQAMSTSSGNITHAAAQLGINRITLWRKMRKYGLSKDNH